MTIPACSEDELIYLIVLIGSDSHYWPGRVSTAQNGLFLQPVAAMLLPSVAVRARDNPGAGTEHPASVARLTDHG